jgi:hypothetical protein
MLYHRNGTATLLMKMFLVIAVNGVKGKGKADPLQACS